MEEKENILDKNKTTQDEFENNIRPSKLDDYVGQSDVKENIRVFVEAAKMNHSIMSYYMVLLD